MSAGCQPLASQTTRRWPVGIKKAFKALQCYVWLYVLRPKCNRAAEVKGFPGIRPEVFPDKGARLEPASGIQILSSHSSIFSPFDLSSPRRSVTLCKGLPCRVEAVNLERSAILATKCECHVAISCTILYDWYSWYHWYYGNSVS